VNDRERRNERERERMRERPDLVLVNMNEIMRERMRE
jgi:hypothetical protein